MSFCGFLFLTHHSLWREKIECPPRILYNYSQCLHHYILKPPPTSPYDYKSDSAHKPTNVMTRSSCSFPLWNSTSPSLSLPRMQQLRLTNEDQAHDIVAL